MCQLQPSPTYCGPAYGIMKHIGVVTYLSTLLEGVPLLSIRPLDAYIEQ